MDNSSKKDIALLWQLADSKLKPEDKQALEERLPKDALLHEKWEEIQVVHKALNALPLASPSMRFQQNVLDRLALQPKRVLAKSELLGTKTKWGILGGIFVMILWLLLQPTEVSKIDGSWGQSFVDFMWLTFDLSIPHMTISATITVGLTSILLLLMLDHWVLKRVFRTRKTRV